MNELERQLLDPGLPRRAELYRKGDRVHPGAVRAGGGRQHPAGQRPGPVPELLPGQEPDFPLDRHGLHRDLPQYAAAAVDLYLPGRLPLPPAFRQENVGPDQRGDEDSLPGGGGAGAV